MRRNEYYLHVRKIGLYLPCKLHSRYPGHLNIKEHQVVVKLLFRDIAKEIIRDCIDFDLSHLTAGSKALFYNHLMLVYKLLLVITYCYL